MPSAYNDSVGCVAHTRQGRLQRSMGAVLEPASTAALSSSTGWLLLERRRSIGHGGAHRCKVGTMAGGVHAVGQQDDAQPAFRVQDDRGAGEPGVPEGPWRGQRPHKGWLVASPAEPV